MSIDMVVENKRWPRFVQAPLCLSAVLGTMLSLLALLLRLR